MIRLLPERTQHSTQKRNKSYTEGIRSHSSETQSLNHHANPQHFQQPKEARRKMAEDCLSIRDSQKWECNIDNLEQLQGQLKSRDKRLRNNRGYFMTLYSKHPRRVQRQQLRLL